MVNDCLHIICGNCGCLLSQERELVKADIQRNYKGEIEDIYITCDNCDTVHYLNKYMDIFD